MNDSTNTYTYWAFISYSHSSEDVKWAEWLHKKLESYKVPNKLSALSTHKDKLPKHLGPIFRDRTDLSCAAELHEKINEALYKSRYLIVICSPNSAKPDCWVGKEVRAFKAMGKESKILSLIIAGEPNASTKYSEDDNYNECFPEALRYKTDIGSSFTDVRSEPLAADVRIGKDRKQDAFLKIIAGLIGVEFDQIKQRQRQRNKLKIVWYGFFLSVILSASFWGWHLNKTATMKIAERKIEQGHQAIQNGDYMKALDAYKQSLQANYNLTADININWSLPLSTPELVSFGGQENRFWANIAFSKDSKSVALPAYGKIYSITNMFKQAKLHSFEIKSKELNYSWFSENGEYVALVSDGYRNVVIRKTHDGTELDRFATREVVYCISFHPNGKQLAIGGNSGIQIRNIDDHSFGQTLKIQQNQVNCLTFSPSGKYLASGLNRGTFQLWNVTDNTKLNTNSVSEGSVSSIAFNSKGDMIATGTGNLLYIWKVSDALEISKVIQTSHNSAVYSIAFHPEVKTVITSGDDRNIQIWDTKDGSNLSTIRTPYNLSTLTISPDGQYIAAYDSHGTTRLWQYNHKLHMPCDLNLFPNSQPPLLSASYSKGTGKILLTTQRDSFQLFNSMGVKLIDGANHLNHSFFYSSISSDGKTIAFSRDKTVWLWRPFNKEVLKLNHESYTHQMVFSPDDKYIAVLSQSNTTNPWDGKVSLWEAKNGQKIAEFGKIRGSGPIAFSPNNEDIAFATPYSITIWNRESEKIIRLNDSGICSLVFSPDGQMLIAGDTSGRIVAKDMRNLAQSSSLFRTTIGFPMNIAMSPDSELLATSIQSNGQNSILLWSFADKSIIARLQHSFRRIFFLSFSHDGKHIVAATDRGIIIRRVVSKTNNPNKLIKTVSTYCNLGTSYDCSDEGGDPKNSCNVAKQRLKAAKSGLLPWFKKGGIEMIPLFDSQVKHSCP